MLICNNANGYNEVETKRSKNCYRNVMFTDIKERGKGKVRSSGSVGRDVDVE